MLELLDPNDNQISMLIFRDNPDLNDGFMLDIMHITNFHLLMTLKINKYSHPVILRNEEVLKLPRKNWNKIIDICTEQLIEMCKLLVHNGHTYESNDQEDHINTLLDIMIEYIGIVSSIRCKLQFLCTHYKEEDAPSIYFNIGKNNMDYLYTK